METLINLILSAISRTRIDADRAPYSQNGQYSYELFRIDFPALVACAHLFGFSGSLTIFQCMRALIYV